MDLLRQFLPSLCFSDFKVHSCLTISQAILNRYFIFVSQCLQDNEHQECINLNEMIIAISRRLYAQCVKI